MATVKLMVLVGSAGKAELFLEENDVWQRLQPRPKSMTLAELQEFIGGKLNAIMEAFNRDQSVPLSLLRMPGNKLFQEMVMGDLDDVLRRAEEESNNEAPILRIYTDVDWIPWELAFNRAEFLGAVFQIARLPIRTYQKIDHQAIGAVRAVRHICNLLGANVLQEGSPLMDQWRMTFAQVLAKPEIEFRRPSRDNGAMDYPALDILLGDEVPDTTDILHITCHGIPDPSGDIAWTLNHEGPPIQFQLDRFQLQSIWDLKLRNSRALVFGNACTSAGGPPIDAKGLVRSGLGAEIFNYGATAFIGTFAPVSQELAVGFASHFYKQLFEEGKTIGAALLAAKQHYSTDEDNHDPSWLFYCLYGPPEIRFEVVP